MANSAAKPPSPQHSRYPQNQLSPRLKMSQELQLLYSEHQQVSFASIKKIHKEATKSTKRAKVSPRESAGRWLLPKGWCFSPEASLQ